MLDTRPFLKGHFSWSFYVIFMLVDVNLRVMNYVSVSVVAGLFNINLLGAHFSSSAEVFSQMLFGV